MIGQESVALETPQDPAGLGLHSFLDPLGKVTLTAAIAAWWVPVSARHHLTTRARVPTLAVRPP